MAFKNVRYGSQKTVSNHLNDRARGKQSILFPWNLNDSRGGAEVNIKINCFPRDQSLSYSVKERNEDISRRNVKTNGKFQY